MPGRLIERLRGNSKGVELLAQSTKSIVAIDPGEYGAVAIWSDLAPSSVAMVPAGNWEAAANAVSRHTKKSAYTLLLEDQFVGRGLSASLEVTWLAGGLFGFLLGASQRQQISLVQVAPETWQSAQRQRMGVSEKLKRDEGIELAIREMPVRFVFETKRTKKQIEGCASAFGILQWWLGKTNRCI